MERFKTSTAPRYHPSISLIATLECDAVVRTVSDHKTLLSLLSPHIPRTTPPYTHLRSRTPTPPAWLDATRELEETLRAPTVRPPALVAAYAARLEAVTAVSLHDFLAEPALTAVAAWVGETDPLASVASLAPPPDAHVLLVARQTRQDDAARPPALASVSNVYGERNVHLVVLDDDGPQSAPSTAAKLDAIARAALAANIADVSKTADKARRAARPSFRSWFTTPAPRTFDEPVSDRRLSLSGRASPRFPPDSLEATTRRRADLYMMAGRYADAADTYRLLQADLRGLSGAAVVHEGSALEMTAMSLALVDGSKQTIGAAFEKAIASYCTAGRTELAVRAALRAVDFCTEAGFPDSAAGVIIRAMAAMLQDKGVATPAGSAFVEAALGVLCSACCVAYRALRRHRRASLYAFLAATRFSKVKLVSAAACIAREVDDRAMFRPSVRQDVELMFGAAEAAEGRHARAVRHFVDILAGTDAGTDVEVQGSAIKGFLSAAVEARDMMSKRWDSGACFPLVDSDLTNVETNDSSGGEEWRALEDHVLEDAEFFRELSKDGKAKRERRVEAVETELRRRREMGDDDNGGSLEMKLRRLRALAEARRKARRTRSLLNRGAVVGEPICVHASLMNPLQFPVFVKALSAVVSIGGRIYHVKDGQSNGVANGGSNDERAEASDSDMDGEVLFFPGEDETLMPCSSQRISLNFSVRKPCDVQIIGLRWMFTVGMGGVSPQISTSYTPGFCLFERRGRRLNDNRQHRASDVPLYAADESLAVQVVPLAPRVKANILCQGENGSDVRIEDLTLHAGEKREGRLIIENEGQVALQDVTLRIGTPENLFVGITPERKQSDQRKSVFAVDVRDEIVQQDELISSARITLNLKSKEKREIPVWIRAAVQDAAFGYRSDLHGNIKRTSVRVGASGRVEDGIVSTEARLILAYGNDKIRVTRFHAAMNVRPSLIVSPRFLRQANAEVLDDVGTDLAGVLLGIEVEHAGAVQHENVSFEVTNLSVTSKGGWMPKSLPEPVMPEDSSSADICPSRSTLRVNETGTFFIFVVQDKSVGSKRDIIDRHKPWRAFTQSLHSGKSQETSRTTQTANGSGLTEQQVSTHFVVCSQLHSILLPVPDSGEVYVSVGWRSGHGAFGELHIPPIDPLRWIKESEQMKPHASSEIVGEETADLIIPRIVSTSEAGDELPEPISVCVIHPPEFEHDFCPTAVDGTSLPNILPAVVAVDVYIKNVSIELIDVSFEAPTAGGVADGDRGRIWTGDVAKTLRAISPSAERVIHLTAVLLGPGEYDMTKFNITYQTTGLTTNVRVRKRFHVEPSLVKVKAKGDRMWMDHDFATSNLWYKPLGTSSALQNASMQWMGTESEPPTPNTVSAERAAESTNVGRAGQTETRNESPRKGSLGEIAASSPGPGKDLKLETPRKIGSGLGLEKTWSRTPVDKIKAKTLLAPSPDDAYWNDADTDESE